MGMAATAYIALGVDLGSEDEYHESMAPFFEGDRDIWDVFQNLDKVQGFTEESPEFTDELRDLRKYAPDDPKLTAFNQEWNAWRERSEAATPIEDGFYGSDEGSGYVVYFKHTLHSVDCASTVVDQDKLLASITPEEMMLWHTVLNVLGFKGEREPRLVLWANYG